MPRGPLKRELLDVYATTSFEVGNFGNREAMRIEFFRKYLKFDVDFENAEESSEKFFRY